MGVRPRRLIGCVFLKVPPGLYKGKQQNGASKNQVNGARRMQVTVRHGLAPVGYRGGEVSLLESMCVPLLLIDGFAVQSLRRPSTAAAGS